MSADPRHRALVGRALEGGLSSEDVEALLLALGGDVHGGLPSDPAQHALGLDLFNAIRELEPEDPSYWWNQGGMLVAQALHIEAATAYLKAGDLIDQETGESPNEDQDNADSGAAARYHAANALLAAGRPLSAAVVAVRIGEPELRAEVEESVRAEVPA